MTNSTQLCSIIPHLAHLDASVLHIGRERPGDSIVDNGALSNREVTYMQLTQREFLFLDDVMAVEHINATRFSDLAQHCSDPQLRQLCHETAQQSLMHFNRLNRVLSQGQGGHGTYHSGTSTTPQSTWSGHQGGHIQ